MAEIANSTNFRDLEKANAVRQNLSEPRLVELSLLRGEARLSCDGALVALTGQHTGRSASDKYVVKDAATEEKVWWEANKALSPEAFARLRDDMLAYAANKELFIQDLWGGADPAHRLPVRVFTEYAWHSLFIRHLLIRPDAVGLKDFAPEFTILGLPGFKAEPARHGCTSSTIIAIDISRRLVLIAGTSYAGEMKKSVFTLLNYLLPEKGVMPMHCSANAGQKGDVAIFFGLSGTGKTTLSADSSRELVGDDEHGWGENGIFNFEGGCYAKVIKLSREAEPEIYATTERFGTVLENVVCHPETGALDLDDDRYTENTRAAYPIHFIPHASETGRVGHPANVIMLTADAFGVLPPIAKLSPSQAMYHFLSGFTARLAGTEKGMGREPEPTFSTCFGAPFMPLHPSVYGNLLRDLIDKHDCDCWLVNTGWNGGPASAGGKRMPIKLTRTLLHAALDGSLAESEWVHDPVFGFRIPKAVTGVETNVLFPRESWPDKAAYDAQAKRLADLFRDNFRKFLPYVDERVLRAAEHIAGAAG
ncbi:phosphoenolpyruvate carboxykinase (ATP) [Rhizomicrobium palustre]|uniref:Phosphoenolpyruvate carboxykinase (ATP) n=1 Tax=Rhizomicrobium palustre TaxID=189966 RepID=A0A846MZ22_9PROT|nr:phosphoenolpyruvate carboxykinase [Rhizomicrobium palustre]NIK88262.1 phosphoenolpyruvate carboxykinase (ATP) [Rhizomicrobium palustre]